jgi:hypothetical protein
MIRLEMMKKSNVVLPDVKPFGYILELLTQAGGYASPLNWTEIQAWRTEMQVDLCTWERDLIHKLSQTFHTAVREYNLQHATSPLEAMTAAPKKKEDIANKIKSVLRSVAPNKNEARRKRKR